MIERNSHSNVSSEVASESKLAIWRQVLDEVKTIQSVSIKEEVHKLADQLSDDATWEDVAVQITITTCLRPGR